MKHYLPKIAAIGFAVSPALFITAPSAHARQTASTKKTAGAQEAPSLSREIQHQILVLPFYSVFDSIHFTLEGNKVTLTGQVLRRTLKEHAEAAVKSIEGVGVVVNQLEVLPASPADDDLRDAVYRALYEDTTLARYAIQNIPPMHIIVKNGAVTLEGSVETQSDKNLAASRASAVANVAIVKNDLQVHARGSATE